MSTDQALQKVLSDERDRAFQGQLEQFREFQERMERGGYTIQRETFSIPLMDRVAPCVYSSNN